MGKPVSVSGENTPESTAALVYGTYSTCALMCRLVGDRLRVAFGELHVVLQLCPVNRLWHADVHYFRPGGS